MSAAVDLLPGQAASLRLGSGGTFTLALSASRITKYLTCSQQYQYYYEDRLESTEMSSNLALGNALDKTCLNWVEHLTRGLEFDPVRFFESKYHELALENVISYSSAWSEPDCIATGKRLVEQFCETWPTLELTPLSDIHGVLWTQRKLEAQIGGPGVIRAFPHVRLTLVGYLDLPVLDREGVPNYVDLKSTAAEYPFAYGYNCDQLTTYDILGMANGQALGIDRFNQLGFLELVKRPIPKGKRKDAKGPEVLKPKMYPARSEHQLRKYTQKLVWIAEDILRKRFAPNAAMAFNTPCTLCDYKDLCVDGSMEGLRTRARRPVAVSL